MDDKVGGPVVAGGLTVNKNQVPAAEEPQQGCGRVNVERSASNDKQIGSTDRGSGVVEILAPQGFLIKNDLGTCLLYTSPSPRDS